MESFSLPGSITTPPKFFGEEFNHNKPKLVYPKGKLIGKCPVTNPVRLPPHEKPKLQFPKELTPPTVSSDPLPAQLARNLAKESADYENMTRTLGNAQSRYDKGALSGGQLPVEMMDSDKMAEQLLKRQLNDERSKDVDLLREYHRQSGLTVPSSGELERQALQRQTQKLLENPELRNRLAKLVKASKMPTPPNVPPFTGSTAVQQPINVLQPSTSGLPSQNEGIDQSGLPVPSQRLPRRPNSGPSMSDIYGKMYNPEPKMQSSYLGEGFFEGSGGGSAASADLGKQYTESGGGAAAGNATEIGGTDIAPAAPAAQRTDPFREVYLGNAISPRTVYKGARNGYYILQEGVKRYLQGGDKTAAEQAFSS